LRRLVRLLVKFVDAQIESEIDVEGQLAIAEHRPRRRVDDAFSTPLSRIAEW
jgi:hypothetical protein